MNFCAPSLKSPGTWGWWVGQVVPGILPTWFRSSPSRYFVYRWGVKRRLKKWWHSGRHTFLNFSVNLADIINPYFLYQFRYPGSTFPHQLEVENRKSVRIYCVLANWQVSSSRPKKMVVERQFFICFIFHIIVLCPIFCYTGFSKSFNLLFLFSISCNQREEFPDVLLAWEDI